MTNLEDLYREIILDHYRSPRNRGELEAPPAHRVEGFNPLCGDEVVVTFVVGDGTLEDIKFAGSGCSISQSSASLMSAAVKGKQLDEVRGLIRTFKSMMSIHEVSLDGDEDGDGNGAGAGAGAGDRNGAPTAEHGRGTGTGGGARGGGARDEDADGDLVDLHSIGELAALQGVVKFPVRIKCATLSWNALTQGLDELATAAAGGND